MRKFDWFVIWFVTLGTAFSIIERLNAEKNFRESYFLRCIDMHEMPLGACSRLFESVSDNDQAKRESGESNGF
jgi:hypothetical protein